MSSTSPEFIKPSSLKSPLSQYFLSPSHPKQPQPSSEKLLSKSVILKRPIIPAPVPTSHSTTHPKNPPFHPDPQTTLLVQKLQTHRQSLLHTLHTQTLLFNLQPLPLCHKHKSHISAYQKTSRTLICAACYSSVPKANMLPLQKSKYMIENDNIGMKTQIEKQVQVIREIEEVLYAGFERERVEMEGCLGRVDGEFGKILEELGKVRERVKESVVERYRMERSKHQAVIKELGMLRTLVTDYLIDTKNLAHHFHSEHPTNIPYLLNSPTIASHFASKSPINSLPKTPTKSHLPTPILISTSTPLHASHPPSSPPPQSLQQLTYKHTVYRQISKNIKFNKSGFEWSAQKHKNIMKDISQYVLKSINKVNKVLEEFQAGFNKYGGRGEVKEVKGEVRSSKSVKKMGKVN